MRVVAKFEYILRSHQRENGILKRRKTLTSLLKWLKIEKPYFWTRYYLDARECTFIQLANFFELSIYEHLGTEIGT